MIRLPHLVAAILAALVLGMAVEPTAPADSQRPREYLRAATAAEALSRAWWDPGTRWYRERLGNRAPATLWGVVHLFEAENAMAIADPSPARKRRVRTFAAAAERYWNPSLRPVGGYGPRPGGHGPGEHAFFDDDGWWGTAFYDAYRATGDRRYLASAKRALTFIDRSGWDRRDGGIWWDTGHRFHAGESLAGGVLLASELYHETRSPAYLRMVRKYLAWADAHVLGADRLYDRHDTDDTPMPYVQGPIFNGFVLLCDATRDRRWCDRAEALADRSDRRFPTMTMGPQYDAMYIRALLELFRYDGNRRWYDIAARETDRAMRNGRRASGLYLNNWAGGSMHDVGTPANMLQTHAATTMVMAWMAATPPPR